MRPEYLYHFTDVFSFLHIVSDGFIDTSCSNLLPPDKKTMRMEWDEKKKRYCFRDKNDGYKPVVWLTDSEYPHVNGLGLIKSKCAIRLKVKNTGFSDWKSFADANHMNRKWRKQFESVGMPDIWYVSEHRIPYSDLVEILTLTKEAHDMLEEMTIAS